MSCVFLPHLKWTFSQLSPKLLRSFRRLRRPFCESFTRWSSVVANLLLISKLFSRGRSCRGTSERFEWPAVPSTKRQKDAAPSTAFPSQGKTSKLNCHLELGSEARKNFIRAAHVVLVKLLIWLAQAYIYYYSYYCYYYHCYHYCYCCYCHYYYY